MKKLKLITVLSLCFIFSSILNAQRNFINGYVINNNGDTIYGLIDYREWSANPDKIAFKKDSLSEIEKFTSLDIKEFKVPGDYYKSAIVDVDKTPYLLDDMKVGAGQNIVRDTLFLNVYITGKVDLYYLIDENKKEHYFIKKDTTLTELVLKRELIKKEGYITGSTHLNFQNFY